MTYRRLYKIHSRGFLMFEVAISLVLSTMFIVIITHAIYENEEVFAHALAKQEALNSSASTSVGYPFEFRRCSPYIGKHRVIGSYLFDLYNSGGASDNRVISLDSINVQVVRLPLETRNEISEVEVRNNVWYVSTDSNIYSDHDLFVFDVSDLLNPVLLSSLNTGPGVSSMEVVNDRIYASQASSQYQLIEVGVGNSLGLELLNAYSVPQPYATTTRPFASAVFARGDYVYLGTHKWVGDELFAFNRHNISDDGVLSSYDVDSKINHIGHHDDSIYVAASAYHQLLRFESGESGLDLMDTFSPVGWSRQEGNVTASFGDHLLFGRTNGGFDIKQDHEVFLWSRGQSLDYPESTLNVSGGIYGAVIDDDFAYIATGDSDEALMVLDLGSSLASSTTIDLPLPVSSMTCYLDRLYLIGEGAPVIYIIRFNK